MFDIKENKIWANSSRILMYALVVYIFIILGRAIYVNWTLKKQIDQIKLEISSITQKNNNFENLILYYQSNSFKELEAREKLGLQKPGEKVVLVPIKKYNDNLSQVEDEVKSLSEKPVTKMPNWRAWWMYIFS